MKKKAITLICGALLILMIVPLINVTRAGNELLEKECCAADFLYNFDFAVPAYSRLLYSFGISIDPTNVIIGKDGWLYLGDRHENAMTIHRTSASDSDIKTISEIADATSTWKKMLQSRNVKYFRIMICPDKNTIYPEFQPEWAKPVLVSISDTLLAGVDSEVYLDSRKFVLAEKAKYREPLYYKTDTHWNLFGAWKGFRALTNNLAQSEGGLLFLSDKQVGIGKIKESVGGDLAKFLRLNERLQDFDPEVVVTGLEHWPVETMQFDFHSGNPVVPDAGMIMPVPQRPLLVKSPNALNQKRVLWLRDSFGNAMAPFMAATFSETLHVHYDKVDPALFSSLIDSYKPDYVFITVVERRARTPGFKKKLLE